MYNLEHLYKKPVPHTKRVWQIGINSEKKAIPVIDKRDESRQIDRAKILERLGAMKEYVKPEEVEPLKAVKAEKLVDEEEKDEEKEEEEPKPMKKKDLEDESEPK
jgi:hypothetical protein